MSHFDWNDKIVAPIDYILQYCRLDARIYKKNN